MPSIFRRLLCCFATPIQPPAPPTPPAVPSAPPQPDPSAEIPLPDWFPKEWRDAHNAYPHDPHIQAHLDILKDPVFQPFAENSESAQFVRKRLRQYDFWNYLQLVKDKALYPFVLSIGLPKFFKVCESWNLYTTQSFHANIRQLLSSHKKIPTPYLVDALEQLPLCRRHGEAFWNFANKALDIMSQFHFFGRDLVLATDEEITALQWLGKLVSTGKAQELFANWKISPQEEMWPQMTTLATKALLANQDPRADIPRNLLTQKWFAVFDEIVKLTPDITNDMLQKELQARLQGIQAGRFVIRGSAEMLAGLFEDQGDA